MSTTIVRVAFGVFVLALSTGASTLTRHVRDQNWHARYRNNPPGVGDLRVRRERQRHERFERLGRRVQRLGYLRRLHDAERERQLLHRRLVGRLAAPGLRLQRRGAGLRPVRGRRLAPGLLKSITDEANVRWRLG